MFFIVIAVAIYGLLAPTIVLGTAIVLRPKSRLEFLIIGLTLVIYAALLVTMATDLVISLNELLTTRSSPELTAIARHEASTAKIFLMAFGSVVGFLFGSTGAGLILQVLVSDKPFFLPQENKRGLFWHPMVSFIAVLAGIALLVQVMTK